MFECVYMAAYFLCLCMYVTFHDRINSCVGQANHRQFILMLLLFLLTSFYGISLVLRSICPRQSLLTAMLYCPGVYNQYRYIIHDSYLMEHMHIHIVFSA